MSTFNGIGPLIFQRLIAGWRLLSVLAFGILIASTLLAIAPVYTRVMNDLGLQSSLEEQIGPAKRNSVTVTGVALGAPANGPREQRITELFSQHIGWLTGSEVRFALTDKFTITTEAGGRVGPQEYDSTIQLDSMSGINDHVRLVDGRFPEATSDPSKLEGMISLEASQLGKLKVGDRVVAVASFDNCNRPPPSDDPVEAAAQARFRCIPTAFVTQRVFVTITGIIQPLDANDVFWTAGAYSFNTRLPTSDQPDLPDYHMVLPEESFFQALPQVLPGVNSQYRFTAIGDLSRLNSSNIDRARSDLAALKQDLEESGAIPDLAMANPLGSFAGRSSFNQIPLILLLLQVVGIAVYYVLLVSSLLAERRAEEIAMLRSRGASVMQVVALSTGEAACLGFVATLVAPFLASGAIAGLGKTHTFESISGGSFLPFTIVPAAFVFALGGAAIAVIATIIPAYFAARRGMLLFLRNTARPGKSILQRYYIDVAMVGAAAFGLWELNQRGSVFESNNVGGWSADPLILLSPFLLILAVGALMFRFLPAILGVVSRIVQATAGPGITLGLWQLTRSPSRYTQLALLVVMAAAVGTFAATYGETTNRSQEERAEYAVGTDVRVTGMGNLNNADPDEVKAAIDAVDGVDGSAAAWRGSLPLAGQANIGSRMDLLGLDPDAAPSLLWFRDDFASEDLTTLLRPLAGSPSQEKGLGLPGEPIEISMWVNPSVARPSTTLWARSRDANGVFRMHELGTLSFSGYQQMVTHIDAPLLGMEYPISIVSILMTQIETVSDTPATLLIDDIAVRDATGEETVVDDFEGGFRWQAIRTNSRTADSVSRISQQAHSGSGAAGFIFRPGQGVGTRGIYVSTPDLPIPAIVSQRLLDRNGIKVGAEVDLALGRLIIPFTIQGAVDFFPTMGDPGDGFMIINQEQLFYYAGVVAEASPNGPNEIWVNLTDDPAQRRAALDTLFDQYSIAFGQVVDIQEVLKKVRTDPVVRAGGSGILLLALLAAFSILALGFALTLYLGGQARTVELSVMRAVGLSPRQVFVMIGLEYLLVASIGLVIGTIAGLRISDTMLSFLNVTEDGGRVVPPFALTTRWDTVGIAFLATAVAFVVGVVALAFYFLRMPVSRVIRLTR